MEFEKVWFREARHTEEINGNENNVVDKELWRKSKDRTKTVSVALVLCLNIAVDPPDVPKAPNGPRKQAWVESVLCSPQKSANKIALSLQSNYEKLQPRARYKTAIDPTIETVKKLCQTLRRNAKEERVLFHFNGHGVPRPTDAGEIWVFNRTITQYIPLSLYDLQSWMGSPTIYVWDCNSAGTIVNMFTRFAEEQQFRALQARSRECKLDETIQMGACRAGELIPQHPDLPADLFTSCLTTPIQTSLLWYMVKTGTKDNYPPDIIDQLPGQLTDRRTVLGELNWIFTAITDTIAWNALSTDTFQRLFRQDLLTASLFRSFLLAERIMLENSCQVVSQPALPSVASHPLWEYWDYTMDICLANISNLRCLKKNILCIGRNEFFVKSSLKHNLLEIQTFESEGTSNFFVDHLKAFEVWLKFGIEKRKPPNELPVILQVLLSQSHRVLALELLAKFVDLGAWAVGAALSVGIFPYVLKLLQSTDPNLRGPLAFIWAKILCVDPECQHELIKENGYFYFIQILNDSSTMPRMKIVPAFVMATLIDKRCRIAQEKLVQSDYMTLCMELLASNEVIKCKMLCLWLLIGLGRLWAEYDKARWNAIRNVAYERAMDFLTDELPEVRAAAVYGLGCFVRNRSVNNEHATTIDNEVCDKMCEKCTFDGSVLVRAELTVAIQWFVIDFEQRFSELFIQLNKTYFAKQFETMSQRSMNGFEQNGNLKLSESKAIIRFGDGDETFPDFLKKMVYENMKYLENKAFNDPFERIWLSLLYLCFDSFPYVSTMARRLIRHIYELATHNREHKLNKIKSSVSPDIGIEKAMADRNPKVKFLVGSPMTNIEQKNVEQLKKCASINDMLNTGLLQTSSTSFTPKRNIYGSQSGRYARVSEEVIDQPVEALVTTKFSEWCSKSFQEPIFKTIYEEVSTSTRNSLVDGSCPFTKAKPTDWALHTYEGLRQKAAVDVELFKNEKIRCDVQHLNVNVQTPQTSMVWSMLRPYLFTCDGSIVSIFNSQRATNVSPLKAWFDASTEGILGDRITELMVANGLTHELVMTGSMNGVLKVWDLQFHEHGHEIEGQPELITTAHLMKDQSRIKLGKDTSKNLTLYRWDQDFGSLVTSGNVRVCRIWDAWAEQVQRDINLRSKSEVVSAMSVNLSNNLISCGFRDGVVNVLDVRLPAKECEIMKFHEFGTAIMDCAITPENQGIIVGSADGDFRFWEPRMFQEPVVEFNVFKDTFSSPPATMRFSATPKTKEYQTIRAVDIQPHGQLISCATNDGYFRLFDVCGKKCLAQTKVGGEGQKGPTAMRFHSHKVMLGVGTDKTVCAFGAPNS